MGGKQADRAAKKQAAKQATDDEPAAAAAPTGQEFVAMAKQLVMQSALVTLAPKIPDMLKGAAPPKSPAPKDENSPPANENEDETSALIKKNEDPDEAADNSDLGVFQALVARLPFYNALGLGLPATGEESKEAWVSLIGLEVDMGPRSRKKGSPAMDRIKANVQANAPQYLHVLLALMMLRAFLFRSWFACLPWLVGYQVLSLMLPLEWPQYPQVPPVEAKYRVAASAGIHALVWLFFLFEALYKTYFIEKLLLVGLFAAHAYVVRPVQA